MKLRTRILTGFALVLVVIAGLGVAVVADQSDQLVNQLDRRLEAVAPLNRQAPRSPTGAPPPAGTPREAPISDVFIATLDGNGNVEVLVQGQLLTDQPDLSGLQTAGVGPTFMTVGSVGGSSHFRVLVDPLPGGGGDAGVVTVIALSTADVDETVQRLVIIFAGVVALTAAILGLLAWWIMRLGLRPISDVTETARKISGGDRDQRASGFDDRTEAGELAGAFNLMLDQRDEAEDRLRRFASDASHELRTPLTSIRGYLDLYAAGGFREPGQLDDIVRRMRSEAERMGLLVEELLQLARSDEGPSLVTEAVDIGVLARDVVAAAVAAHPDRSLEVTAPEAGALIARADRHKITQLLTILVDNALTHAPEAMVELHASAEAAQLRFVVADDGPGLSETQAGQVFTRFYRADPSRARSAGGSGLGLAIAASIAEAHGGAIDLRTAPGEGCEFTVRLPTRAP